MLCGLPVVGGPGWVWVVHRHHRRALGQLVGRWSPFNCEGGGVEVYDTNDHRHHVARSPSIFPCPQQIRSQRPFQVGQFWVDLEWTFIEWLEWSFVRILLESFQRGRPIDWGLLIWLRKSIDWGCYLREAQCKHTWKLFIPVGKQGCLWPTTVRLKLGSWPI